MEHYEIEGLSVVIKLDKGRAVTALLLMAPSGRIERVRGKVILHIENENDVKDLRKLVANYQLEYHYPGSRYEKVAGIEHAPAREEVEKNRKVAILNLHAADDGSVLCQAFDPPNGELQPEDLADDPILDAYMPTSDTEEGDTEAEKQCVRSVLGNLAKLGYDGAVLWEGSELEPAWIKNAQKLESTRENGAPMTKSELKTMFIHDALTEEQVNLLKEFGVALYKLAGAIAVNTTECQEQVICLRKLQEAQQYLYLAVLKTEVEPEQAVEIAQQNA